MRVPAAAPRWSWSAQSLAGRRPRLRSRPAPPLEVLRHGPDREAGGRGGPSHPVPVRPPRPKPGRAARLARRAADALWARTDDRFFPPSSSAGLVRERLAFVPEPEMERRSPPALGHPRPKVSGERLEAYRAELVGRQERSGRSSIGRPRCQPRSGPLPFGSRKPKRTTLQNCASRSSAVVPEADDGISSACPPSGSMEKLLRRFRRLQEPPELLAS